MQSLALPVVNHLLVTLGMLILVGVVTAKLAHLLAIPDVVLFLLAGVVIGPSLLNLIYLPGGSTANQLVLVFGAAMILFTGGLSLDFQVLKQTWKTIVLLATVGVMVTAAITGYAARLFLGLPLTSALMLATVIAATDPATLIPIFEHVKIRDRVCQTVLAESAFNDATGAILTFTMLSVLTTGTFSITRNVFTFAIMAGGGLVVGIIIGLIVAHLIAHYKVGVFAPYSAVTVLLAVVFSYEIAVRVGGSGYMAVFVVGIISGNLPSLKLKHHAAYALEQHHFISNLALIMRMLIFVLLGSQISFDIISKYFFKGILIIAIFMLVARPTTVMVSTWPDHAAGWQSNEMLFMFWVRETGVMPAALSGLLVGMKVPYAHVIASITFMTILTTILVQATTTKLVATRLGLLDER